MGDVKALAAVRETEAWEARYKHGKAARAWNAVALEKPETSAIWEALSRWMSAYEEADARAEAEFRALSASKGGGDG